MNRESLRARKRRQRLLAPPSHAASGGAVRSEINVTPLVDVVLVLLIIFMVVTPMLTRGMKLELPEALHPEKRPDTGDQIVVSVTEDHNVYIDTEQVPNDRLVELVRHALAKKRSDGGEREVHVKGDRRLSYGDVRKVLERLHEAGAGQIALGADEAQVADGSN